MARQPRLRLSEDFGEVHDAKGAPRGEREEPQSGRLGGGAKSGEQAFHACQMT